MAETKYGQYVKSLTFTDDGPGLYRQGTKMTGEFLGQDVHIQYGTYWSAGRMGKEPYGPEVHDFDQVMFWLGADTNDLGELGAEVELCLGEEMQKHMITTSTAVFVPKGLPHLPATINRMDKRFIFLVVSMAPEVKATLIPSDGVPSEPVGWQSKYRDRILQVPFIRKGAWSYGPNNRDDSGGALASIRSRDSDFLIMCESLKRAPYRFGPVPDKPHTHPNLEILIFMGADCNDLSEFPAEVEVYMGKEMEKHLVTTPSVAIQPKGHPHCPVIVNKQDKPWIFAVVRPWGWGGQTRPR